MIVYKDKTHCRGYKNSEKCKACDRYFNQKEYDQFYKERGYKLPISFFTTPLCEKGDKEAKELCQQDLDKKEKDKISESVAISG